MLELIISLSLHQACLVTLTDENVECFKISHGGVLTPRGSFEIDEILLNPLPLHPITGVKYPASKLHRVITTNSNELFLHGWDNSSEVGVRTSLGCINFTKEDIDTLIFNYLFNKITING